MSCLEWLSEHPEPKFLFDAKESAELRHRRLAAYFRAAGVAPPELTPKADDERLCLLGPVSPRMAPVDPAASPLDFARRLLDCCKDVFVPDRLECDVDLAKKRAELRIAWKGSEFRHDWPQPDKSLRAEIVVRLLNAASRSTGHAFYLLGKKRPWVVFLSDHQRSLMTMGDFYDYKLPSKPPTLTPSGGMKRTVKAAAPPSAKKLWEFRHPPTRATGSFEGGDLTVVDDVLGLWTDGLLAFHALDLRSGRLRWSFELRKREKPYDALLGTKALVPVPGGWVALCHGRSNLHLIHLDGRTGPGPSRLVPKEDAGSPALCAADGDAQVHFLGDRVFGTFDVPTKKWIRWTPDVPWKEAPPERESRGYALKGSLITLESSRKKDGSTDEPRLVFRDPKTGRERRSIDLKGGWPRWEQLQRWKDRLLVPLLRPDKKGLDVMDVDAAAMKVRILPTEPGPDGVLAVLGDHLYWVREGPPDSSPGQLLCALDLRSMKVAPARALNVGQVACMGAWQGSLLLAAGPMMRWDPKTDALTTFLKSPAWSGFLAAGDVAVRFASLKGCDAWALPAP